MTVRVTGALADGSKGQTAPKWRPVSGSQEVGSYCEADCGVDINRLVFVLW